MPERSELVNQFNAILRSILEIEPDRLARVDLGARLSFKGILDRSIEIQKICRRLSKVEQSGIPDGEFAKLNEYLGRVLEHFNTILRFDPTDGRHMQRHSSMPSDSVRVWNEAYSVFSPVIIFDAYGAAVEDSEKLLPELSKIRSEVQALVNGIKDDLKDSVLAKEAKHFLVEAEAQVKWSRAWFWITAGLSVALVVYAYCSLNAEIAALPVDAPVRRIVAVSLPRLIILSVSWFFVLLCARNYTACRHNHVVNRHRQNALAAFRTFAASPSDPQTKDAILIQATQCIFSPQSTGYLKGESEHQGMNQVIELIRSAPAKVALQAK